MAIVSEKKKAAPRNDQPRHCVPACYVRRVAPLRCTPILAVAKIQKEVSNLLLEIDRVSETSKLFRKKLRKVYVN